VGLKLIILIVSRAMSLLVLSRRESWWKDAEILMLRHQIAVAQRERPQAQSRLTWPDRVWLALLAGTLPIEATRGDAAHRHSRHPSCACTMKSSADGGRAVAPRPVRPAAGAP
jgi:hypothetical protein